MAAYKTFRFEDGTCYKQLGQYEKTDNGYEWVGLEPAQPCNASSAGLGAGTRISNQLGSVSLFSADGKRSALQAKSLIGAPDEAITSEDCNGNDCCPDCKRKKLLKVLGWVSLGGAVLYLGYRYFASK